MNKKELLARIKFAKAMMKRYEKPTELEAARCFGFYDGYMCALKAVLGEED